PRARIDIMFHEVAFPLRWGQPIAHNVLGVGTRLVSAIAALSAQRIFVAVPAWTRVLAQLVRGLDAVWLPVPSNVDTECPEEAVVAVRARLAAKTVVGH